jgi:transposase InsO family protein
MDVKKIGRIPDGGGWRAHGRQMGSSWERKKTKVGYDYVHSVVDDHSRLGGPTCAAFLARAAEYFAAHGIGRIERVMTDNAWNYTHSRDMAAVLAQLDAKHKLIRPHCPWQNGKVERYNQTLAIEWAPIGRPSPATTTA